MTNHPDFQVVQRILENVRAGRDITIGDIHQIYQIVINLNNIPKPTGFPQNIPASNTDNFVGRERELERLHQQLQRNNDVVIAAVEGMGGVGKTELAIQYSLLHLQSHTYPGGICWLQAIEEDIGLQIIKFARTYSTLTDLDLQPPKDLKLPEQVQWYWHNWHQGNTLVVLDDVKNYRKIKPYLPPQLSQFKVIITSRLKLDLAGAMFLEVLPESDALELLAQLVGEEKITQELEEAKELCQRLGYLPLALQLVGQYVKKRKISLAEMLRRLEEKGLGHPSLVVNENDPTLTRDIKRGVAAALELSWEDLSASAQELGCLISLFALAPIPWSLVERAAPEQNSEALEDARVELENLHLLQGEETYQLHQLIQEFLRIKQNNLAFADEQKYSFCQAMLEVVQEIPQTPTQKETSTLTPTIPHLLEALEYAYQTWQDIPERASLFINSANKFAIFLGYLGKLQERIELGKKALEVAEKTDNALAIAEICASTITWPLLQFGKYEDAEKYCERGMEIAQKIPNYHLAGRAAHTLAGIARDRGRIKEAKYWAEKLLQVAQQCDDKNLKSWAFMDLGYAAFLDKDYVEAESQFRLALKLTEESRNNLQIANRSGDLALTVFNQGRITEARQLIEKVLELAKEIKSDVLDGELKFALAMFERIAGNDADADKLVSEGSSLFKGVGIERPGRWQALAYIPDRLG